MSLSPETLGRFRSTGLPVVMPSWLPAGFSVERAEVECDRAGKGFACVTLKDPTGASVQIHTTNSGVGDVFRGQRRSPFEHPAFGSGDLEWYDDPEEGVDFRSPWLPVRKQGFPQVLIAGRGLSAESAVRVVESLGVVEAPTPA